MSWINDPPAEAPPEPGHVNVEWLMQQIQAKPPEAQTLADRYLLTGAPKQQLDKWGDPLPLCASDQDRLDRVFAVIASPYDRTRALLRAGMLEPNEVDAVQAAFPEIYDELVRQADLDLMTTKPPRQQWAETVIGVLLGKPAAEVVNPQAGTVSQPDNAQPPKKTGNSKSAPAGGMPTQADRREQAVRENS